MDLAKKIQIKSIMEHENLPRANFDKMKEFDIVWETYA